MNDRESKTNKSMFFRAPEEKDLTGCAVQLKEEQQTKKGNAEENKCRLGRSTYVIEDTIPKCDIGVVDVAKTTTELKPKTVTHSEIHSNIQSDYLSTSGDGCNVVSSTTPSEAMLNNTLSQSDKTKDRMHRIIGVAAIFVMILAFLALNFLSNHPGFFKGYHENSGVPTSIEYYGGISKLVNKDDSLLEDFLYDQEFGDSKKVYAVYCKDYAIRYAPEGHPSVDWTPGNNNTIYLPGLIEYEEDTTNNYYKRFWDDIPYEVQNKKTREAYYFYTAEDAEQWLTEKFG